MNPVARLVFPALRWRDSTGYDHERASIDETLALGVGGYILFGGERDAAARLVEQLQSASAHPLLIGADFERGAGQQLTDLTELPPPAALGFINDSAITAQCGAVTAREARAAGVNWVYAPVADLDLEAANPIIQTRSFGDVPDRVASHVTEWIGAAEANGVLSCAKHYPGHGRTTADSHETLPHVPTPLAELRESDLVPFRAAVASGVSSVMTAHVAYDGWDGSRPATLSARVLGYLRREVGFRGLIVTDALIMEGALRGRGEVSAASAAVAAGCDALLYPRNAAAVVSGLERDRRNAGLTSRLDDALERVTRWSAAAAARAAGPVAPAEHRTFAAAVADLAVHTLRGTMLALHWPLDVTIIDDDVGGPYRVGPRDRFVLALRDAGVSLQPGGDRVVLIYAEPRSWKGRAGLGERSRAALARVLPDARLIVLFAHPRLLNEIAGDVPVVCAWHGQVLMQHAAARWVLGRLRGG